MDVNKTSQLFNKIYSLNSRQLRTAVASFFRDHDILIEEFIGHCNTELRAATRERNNSIDIKELDKLDHVLRSTFLGLVWQDIVISAEKIYRTQRGGSTQFIIANAIGEEKHLEQGVDLKDYATHGYEIPRFMIANVNRILKSAGFKRTTTTAYRKNQETVWVPMDSLKGVSGKQMARQLEDRLSNYIEGVVSGELQSKESSSRF